MSDPISKFAVIGMAVLAILFVGVRPIAAHQPRLVTSDPAPIIDPEVSKAFYGELTGAPELFSFTADRTFQLYVGLLVPDLRGIRTDLSLEIRREGELVAQFDAVRFEWKKMFEPFAGDNYLQGPEFRSANAPAGKYEILVSGPENRGKYVLAVGEAESFPLSETLGALRVIPGLKSGFFNKSRATFLFSVFGSIEFVFALLAGLLAGILWRALLKLAARTRSVARRNIGRPDRQTRLGLALVALAAGLWFWNPALMFIAGFVLFEAAAGWCALYAAIGRNTCPIG